MNSGNNKDDGVDFNPRSIDSSFTALFYRLDAQDAILARIEKKMEEHTGKVDALEKEKWVHRGMSFSGFLAACHHVLTRWGGG